MNSHLALRTAILWLGLACATGIARGHEGPHVPHDFVVENAVPGHAFNTPTAIAPLPDGRLLVAEKRGVLWVVPAGGGAPRMMWSAEREVLNNGDRGLIGLAVDPDFAHNRYLYLLYCIDPDSNDVDDDNAAFGRLTRFQTSLVDPDSVDWGSRTVLLGKTWRDGPPSASLSHGVGGLRWGTDGSLLVTVGDGAHYSFADAGGRDSLQFAPGRTDASEDIGSFRAQFPGSLAGKLLRINPATGHGYATNPYATADLSEARSKVWAYGLRNPFRFCVRPGSGSADTSAADPGTLYIGDVGLNAWEEINVQDRPGMNFGWPCNEGPAAQPKYSKVSPAHHGCASIGTPDNPALATAPTFAWSHDDSAASRPFGLRGNCTTGGIFYTGALYPPHYRGRLLFGDFGGGWLKVATLDSLERIVQLQDFGADLEGPVDWAADPISGDILYVSIYTGEVRRIRYTGDAGDMLPPVARVSASPTIGVTPATINLSSLGSYDPQGGTVTYTWDFGDGSYDHSSPVAPTHVYTEPGTFDAILTVTGTQGAVARDTVHLVVIADPGFPTTGMLDSLTSSRGELGPKWAGTKWSVKLIDSALVQIGGTSSNIVWNDAVFSANQEVFYTFDALTVDAPEHDLLLKVQGATWTTGAIQVVYSAPQDRIVVNTYDPATGWRRCGGPWPAHFGAGDQFGARAYSNGVLEVYRNGNAIGTTTVRPWAYYASGGRVGLMLQGASATRLVHFGGGDVPLWTNEPPVARILSPADGTFFHAGQRIVLSGVGTDPEDDADHLATAWSVDLLHNNHQHPNSFVSLSITDTLTMEEHDDGTGVHERVRFVVTDQRGAADTATVFLYPEIDVEPVSLGVSQDLGAGDATGTTTYAFTIVNHGRMLAPRSRWALLAGGTVIAEGDTIVRGLDSVRVVRTIPSLPAGGHEVRVVVDTTGRVVETNEGNNVLHGPWTVAGFPATTVIDAFDRADGPLVAPWSGIITGLAVSDSALVQTTTSSVAVWGAETFGADQEAYVTFERMTAAAPEHNLLLKVQGTTWQSGAIQVKYDGTLGQVLIFTYAPAEGWKRRGGPWAVRFDAGDQLGARANAAGDVTVYENGVAIGAASVQPWTFATSGGRVGLMLKGATESRLVRFGGGNLPIRRVGSSNAAPHATIDSPSDGALFRLGERVHLCARGADVEDRASELSYEWLLEPAPPAGVVTLLSGAEIDSLTAEQLAAGQWTSRRIRLVVRDQGGLTDTAFVTVHAEVELRPTALEVAQDFGGGGLAGTTTYAFTLHNSARMAAPRSRWMLLAGETVVAEGDTLVPARDSVRVTRTLRSLPLGDYALRVVIDRDARIVELDEENNAVAAGWTVAGFPVTPVLDDFARGNGPLGSNWAGNITGLKIAKRGVVQTTAASYAVWSPKVFGPDQEAYFRFGSVTETASEQNLLLKAQGMDWSAGVVQVKYLAERSQVWVFTYTAGEGWKRRGGPWNVHFANGDQFGARALANGSVVVVKNGVVIGECGLGDWPFAAQGGRIGIMLRDADRTRVHAFGGGNVLNRIPGNGATPVDRGDLERASAGRESVEGETTAAVLDVPSVLALSLPYPNPSPNLVQFRLELPKAETVRLAVFDAAGRVVRSEERSYGAGRWTLRWDRTHEGARVAGGIYFVRVDVGPQRFTRRVTLLQ